MKKSIAVLLLGAVCIPAFAAENAALAFYERQFVAKAKNAKQDKAFAAALAQDVAQWLRANEDNPEAKTALLMQAQYLLRAQQDAPALVTFYQVRFYFPAQADLAALSSNVENIMDRLSRDQKAQALKLLAVDTTPLESLPQRKAALLEQLVQANFKQTYEPVSALFEDFFAQYPSYEQTDKLTLRYGDWHRQNGNYLAAITEYKKVHELFPSTAYKAASVRMMADVYASELKDYDAATALYNQVLKQYPDSAERGIVYKHLAVMEENRKNYPSALSYYDKAIADLGRQPAAYEAWRGKADVQVKVRDYQAAYDTLIQGANLFAGDEDKYVALLTQAASVANRRLKDPLRQITALDQALLAYPQTQTAPQLMYELGYAYEKSSKQSQAIDVYKRLIIKYPTDKYAARAQSRLGRLEK